MHHERSFTAPVMAVPLGVAWRPRLPVIATCLRRAAGCWTAPLPDRSAGPVQETRSISPGRQLLSKKDSSGLYRRRITNQPFLGSVWIQLPRATPAGCVGPK